METLTIEQRRKVEALSEQHEREGRAFVLSGQVRRPAEEPLQSLSEDISAQVNQLQ